MQYSIDREMKIIRVDSANPITCGWLGFQFAKEHRGLVDAGWEIHYDAPPSSFGENGTLALGGSLGATALAELIEAGPPKPPNHCETCTCPPESGCCT